MTDIAPVLFDAFPEDAEHTREAPYRSCFNAGATSEAVRTLSASYKEPTTITAALFLTVVGAIPIVGGALLGFLFVLEGQVPGWAAWVTPVLISGILLTIAGGIWSSYLASRFHPRAKAWKKSLSEAWAAHGSDITELWRLGNPRSSEVRDYAEQLEDIRKGLNKLDPEGDELDGARYALQRFIDVSDIPLLGKRAAEATHIKDPAVRKAAKEYKLALQQKEFARKAVESEIEGASDLLAARRQARTDAEIIRLVHER